MKDKILDKFISFDKLLGVTALTIALVSAFFSVYGIATLFAGAFILTAIMASSLEIGKLVTVTFLYRYWNSSKGFLKFYLTTAAVILMIITSLGIFGFLSAAYQKSAIEYKVTQDKITAVENQKPYLNDKIKQSQDRIKTLNEVRAQQEARMNETLTNSYLTRNPLQLKNLQQQTADMISSADNDIKAEQQRIQTATDDLGKLDQQVNDMRLATAGKKDIKTFQFVADQFNTTLDNVAKWFICTLIFVFDPLAVALVLAYNVVAYKKPAEDKLRQFEVDLNKPDSKLQVFTTGSMNIPCYLDDPKIPESMLMTTESVIHPTPTPPTSSAAPASAPHVNQDMRRMFKL